MRGEFIHVNTGKVIPNSFTDEGETSFLKMIGQADVVDVSAGGNFYLGLMEDLTGDTTTLADLTGEPTSAGGYARQPITRDGTGWATTGTVNGIAYIETAEFSFVASGADFSIAVWRLFLCNLVSGTAGLLFSISSPFAAALQILNGETHTFKYRLYLR